MGAIYSDSTGGPSEFASADGKRPQSSAHGNAREYAIIEMLCQEVGAMPCFVCRGTEETTGADGYSYCCKCGQCLGLPTRRFFCRVCGHSWLAGSAVRCDACNSTLVKCVDDLDPLALEEFQRSDRQPCVPTSVNRDSTPSAEPVRTISELALTSLSTDIRDRQDLSPLDRSDLRQFRRKALLKIARAGARYLPESLNFFYLLLPFLALQRGDGLPLENYGESCTNSIIELKQRIEGRARDLRLNLEALDEHFLPNFIYLISISPAMTLMGATARYLESVSKDRLDLAPRGDLETAERMVRSEIVLWLRQNGIPFSIRPPVEIPTTTLRKLLQPFRGVPDFHLGEEIPTQKLANACEAAHVPDGETICALLDCTYFGSAKDCVLFGSRAIYFNNGGVENFLPYSEFPDVTFYPGSGPMVCYGEFGSISLEGSSFPTRRLADALDAIKREAIKLEPSANMKEKQGLATLPGMSDLKRMLLEEVVEPLRDPERFKKYKIGIPNGILMYGPPGCGKTFVAQRLANELNYSFYEVSPSTVGSSYIHESASNIRKLFDEAAKNSTALMFVDEFEGMVPARRSLGGEQQFKAEEVNEWLVQIGSCSQRRILFVAATNEPWGIDDAVQRSGRFDKKVYIGPPDLDALGEMLLHHLEGRPLKSSQDVMSFAATIEGQGYSASDLKLLVDEAAKLAMKGQEDISSAHLLAAAVEKVLPSISHEQEDTYFAFKEQRRAPWTAS